MSSGGPRPIPLRKTRVAPVTWTTCPEASAQLLMWALLILSTNVRLMGIVAKLPHLVHAKHDAAKGGRQQEADAYSSPIQAVEQRAEMIRHAFLFSLLALAGTLLH